MNPPLKFVSAYPVYTKPASHYRLHAHPFHEVILVQHGSFRTRVGNEEHTAIAGDVLIYTAHLAHEEWAESKNTVVTWCCWFEGDIFNPDEFMFRKDTNGKVQTLLGELFALHAYVMSDGKDSREQECQDTLALLVEELSHLKTPGTADVIERSRAYIRSNLARPLTVDELAKHVRLSRGHFSFLYKNVAGLTPRDDIQRLRVEEAKHLIETTTLPLREIAPKVGIANEYHLSRLLKSLLKTGVRQLRQSQSEQD